MALSERTGAAGTGGTNSIPLPRLRFENSTNRIQLRNKTPQAQVARTLFPFLIEFKKTSVGEFKLHPRLRFENSINRIQLLIKIPAGELKKTPVGEFKLMS